MENRISGWPVIKKCSKVMKETMLLFPENYLRQQRIRNRNVNIIYNLKL